MKVKLVKTSFNNTYTVPAEYNKQGYRINSVSIDDEIDLTFDMFKFIGPRTITFKTDPGKFSIIADVVKLS